jgi:hypothetical protein
MATVTKGCAEMLRPWRCPAISAVAPDVLVHPYPQPCADNAHDRALPEANLVSSPSQCESVQTHPALYEADSMPVPADGGAFLYPLDLYRGQSDHD